MKAGITNSSSLPLLENKIEPFEWNNIKEPEKLFVGDINSIIKIFKNFPHNDLINSNFKKIYELLIAYFNHQDKSEQTKTKIQLLKTATHILQLFFSDPKLETRAMQNADVKKALGKLYLLCGILSYEEIIGSLNQNHNVISLEFIRVTLLQCEFVDMWLDIEKEPNSPLNSLRKQLWTKVKIIEAILDPRAMDVKELQFHINRKNAQSKKIGGTYHGEVLFYSPRKRQLVDLTTVEALFPKINNIKNKSQPRTQFFVYLSNRHCLLLDIGWNSIANQLEIICVESTATVEQHALIFSLEILLNEKNIKYKIIACQADVQKDPTSCLTFTLMLGSLTSKISFNQLLQNQSIPQPSFDVMQQQQIVKESLPDLIDILWLPITAFGEKAIMTGQSFVQMRNNLLALYPNQEANVEKKIKNWQRWYEMDDSIDEKKKKTYVTYRRNSLRLKATSNSFADINIAKIPEKLGVNTLEQAIRLQGAGAGPLREMRKLLQQATPEIINSVGGDTGRTALHWAYIYNKPNRIRLLKENGAREDIKDNHQNTPFQYKKKSLIA